MAGRRRGPPTCESSWGQLVRADLDLPDPVVEAPVQPDVPKLDLAGFLQLLSQVGGHMMREIAASAGNFRGVCPIIGRLRKSFPQRLSLCHGQVPAFCAGIFYEPETKRPRRSI